MKEKVIWLGLSFLLVVAMVLASCGTKTTSTIKLTTMQTIKLTTTTTTPTSTPTITTPMKEEPQYGGRFTFRIDRDPPEWDPFFYLGSSPGPQLWYETLAMPDLSIDRNICDFKTLFYPLEYNAGRIAESWEIAPDFKSYTIHMRKGAHWQDIPPVNGREITAYDIEWNWNRFLALGKYSFTKPNPLYPVANYDKIVSVTAIDKYTVVFQISQPSIDQLRILLDTTHAGWIVAREAVEKWGDVNNWKRQIGTGPFILTDYVSGSSITTIRNADYYRFDPNYPENKLPYLDGVKMLIIPDLASALAALRTGKIDMIEAVNWQQADSLKNTNPELLQANRPLNGDCIMMMVDKKPFDDFRVRRAMQMAIDLKTIAKTHYGGYADGIPIGLTGNQGYYIPLSVIGITLPKNLRMQSMNQN